VGLLPPVALVGLLDPVGLRHLHHYPLML
jgi:hypothetical protein